MEFFFLHDVLDSNMIFQDFYYFFNDSQMEFYDVRYFCDSQIEFYDCHDLCDSLMEFYDFHDLVDSRVGY